MHRGGTYMQISEDRAVLGKQAGFHWRGGWVNVVIGACKRGRSDKGYKFFVMFDRRGGNVELVGRERIRGDFFREAKS